MTRYGHLCGLMVRAEAVPDRRDVAALIAHFRFSQDHHRPSGLVHFITRRDGRIGECDASAWRGDGYRRLHLDAKIRRNPQT